MLKQAGASPKEGAIPLVIMRIVKQWAFIRAYRLRLFICYQRKTEYKVLFHRYIN